MGRPVCYDITRLLTRVLNATPNGIDRVDVALASHFLRSDGASFGATATGFGSRLIEGAAAAEAVEGIGRHWGESGRDPDTDPIFRRVVDFLNGRDMGDLVAPGRKKRLLPADPRLVASWIRRHGLPITRKPAAHLPPHSLYFNASQFPLWVASSFEWLESRPDIRAAFFIHDLLPISMPEYFRRAEFERHQKRMRNFARFAAAAVVTTRTVASDLQAHLATLGRRDCPIFVSPTPISAVFGTQRVVEPELANTPFFVLCSTLEPRKNHLMILAVWRALVERLGREAPKLVLVGTRGWHYGPIVDLIERCPALRSHVLEVRGLSTPALKRLIDNAQALLMPSFAEGYGLPVHEAIAAGAPVLASDVSAFREIEAGDLTLLSPLDGEAWLEEIAARTRSGRSESESVRRKPSDWQDYFAALDNFRAEL